MGADERGEVDSGETTGGEASDEVGCSLAACGELAFGRSLGRVLTANFYAYLGARMSGINVNDPAFRSGVSPLNTPADSHLVGLVRDASTSSFHIAMMLGAALLLMGAIVNAAWLGGIIVNLLLIPGYYDIALRDFGLLLAAVALQRLASTYDTRPVLWPLRTAQDTHS